MTAVPSLSAPVPVIGHESGALFDPRIVVVPAGHVLEAQAAAGGWATATTVHGLEVRVAARLASAPATSYVYVQTGDKLRKNPWVVSAHGDLLLLYMPAVIPDPESNDDPAARSRWFVYSRAHTGRPWLRRLPHVGCLTAWLYDPSAIVSLPGGEFIVAAFQLYDIFRADPPAEDAHLLRYSSAADEWELKPLTMPYDGDALRPCVWSTDKAFCSADGSIYLLDSYVGLLSCSVLDGPVLLRFVGLPEIKTWRYAIQPYIIHPRKYSDTYRTAGARGGGAVVFVNVDNGLFGTLKRSGFSVTTWALKTTPEFVWEEMEVLQVDTELWSLPNFKDSPLPRWVPHFPMVSTQQHVLHLDDHSRYASQVATRI